MAVVASTFASKGQTEPTTTAAPGEEGVGSAAAIVVAGLVVEFPQFVLGPLDLRVDRGEVVCLVGPNGSGKTTLLRTLVGLQPPSRGSVTVEGRSTLRRPRDLVRGVGYVPEDEQAVIPELTAPELWDLHVLAQAPDRSDRARLRARANRLSRHLDFHPPGYPIAAYSHGMRRKTQIVAALLHDPPVVILDEARNGLDPIACHRLDQLVTGLRGAGCAILLTSHDLYYAERVADRVALLHQGRLLAVGSPDELLEPTDADLASLFFRLINREGTQGA